MSDSGPLRVGVVGGTRLPGNVQTFLTNVRDLLTDHPATFDFELVVSDAVDAPEGYATVDPGFDESDRALDTLRTLTAGLTGYARDNPVDLLFQVTKFPLHGCASTVAGRRTDTPVLTRFAGDNFREYHFSSGLDAVKTFGLNNLLGRVPVHWSDRVIVLGPYGRSEIAGRNDDVPVEVVPQPVDRDQFSPVSPERQRELARDFGFPTDERVFLTVGRLDERKGMKTLSRAAKRLSERGATFRWYVLGEGPMRQELKATPGVTPLGRVDFGAIADYYRVADLVVHPSLVDGLPNVLLEAAACGTPTVARDVGECDTVASETFSLEEALPDLLLDDHEPVELNDRFSPDRIRMQYAEALFETADVA